MGQSTIDGGEVNALIRELERQREPDRQLDARFHCIVGDFQAYVPSEVSEDVPIWAEPETLWPGFVMIHVGPYRRHREEAPRYTASIDAAVAGYNRLYQHPYMVISDPSENNAIGCFGPNAAAGFPLSVAEHTCKPPQPAMALMLATLYAVVGRKQKD